MRPPSFHKKHLSEPNPITFACVILARVYTRRSRLSSCRPCSHSSCKSSCIDKARVLRDHLDPVLVLVSSAEVGEKKEPLSVLSQMEQLVDPVTVEYNCSAAMWVNPHL